jgi:hypothetical protein
MRGHKCDEKNTARKYTITSEPQKEITISDTNVECVDDDAARNCALQKEMTPDIGCVGFVMRNCVLMYRFNLTVNNFTTKYMFVRMESDCVTGGLISLVNDHVSIEKTKCDDSSRSEERMLEIEKCIKLRPGLTKSEYRELTKKNYDRTVDTRIYLDKMNMLTRKDIKVTEKILSEYVAKQDFYNEYLRTGTELFLSSEILDEIK